MKKTIFVKYKGQTLRKEQEEINAISRELGIPEKRVNAREEINKFCFNCAPSVSVLDVMNCNEARRCYLQAVFFDSNPFDLI